MSDVAARISSTDVFVVNALIKLAITSCAARWPPQYAPAPWPSLLTLKSVWESHVTWGTPVQSFVFLGLLIFELEPMYATSDRQTADANDRLMPPPPLRGRGHNNGMCVLQKLT